MRLGVTPKLDTIFVTDSSATSLQLTPTVNVNGSETATPQAPTSVKWSSRDTAVAVVNDSGRVIPRGIGTVTILAEAGGQDAVAQVTVAYAVTRLVVSAGTITGVVGDSAAVSARALLPGDTTALPGVAYTFTSSDPTVAQVVALGTGQARLRFLKSGTVRVTVAALDLTSTVAVTVQPPRLVVTPTTFTGLVAGDTARVTAQAFNLQNVPLANVAYRFTVSDTTVAAIDSVSPGVARVRFLRAGPVTIGVTANEATATIAAAGGAPLAVAPLALTSVAVGRDHGCGVVGPGRLYCWGRGDAGQLGIPGDSLCFDNVVITTDTLTGRPIPGRRCDLSPQRVPVAAPFASVAAGDSLSCGITTTGEAYCWGGSLFGQTGTGRTQNVTAPRRITGSVRFSAISGGFRHACGVGVATSGTGAFCRG